MPVMQFLSAETVTSGLTKGMTDAFSSALDVIQTDVMSMISAALPKGLLIMGAILAIKVGVRFFRNVVG